MNPGRIAPTLVLLLAAAGCETAGEKQPDPAREEAAVREFDITLDKSFAGAAETMMDMGYVISVSDRRAGLLCGQVNPMVSGYHPHLTLLVTEVSPQRSAVRTQPILGQEFWTMYERRLLMADPVPVEEKPATSTTNTTGTNPAKEKAP
jgi:hypothetical protein